MNLSQFNKVLLEIISTKKNGIDKSFIETSEASFKCWNQFYVAKKKYKANEKLKEYEAHHISPARIQRLH